MSTTPTTRGSCPVDERLIGSRTQADENHRETRRDACRESSASRMFCHARLPGREIVVAWFAVTNAREVETHGVDAVNRKCPSEVDAHAIRTDAMNDAGIQDDGSQCSRVGR